MKIDLSKEILGNLEGLTKIEIQERFIKVLESKDYEELRIKHSLPGKRLQLFLVANPKDNQWVHLGEMRTTGDSHQKIEIADVFILKKYIPLKASLMEFMKSLDMINKNTGIDVFFKS